MKRNVKTTYSTDAGRELLYLTPDGKAAVGVHTCTADELDQLATAAMAAAEELRSLAEPQAAPPVEKFEGVAG
jgi:hypothetical protein